MWKLIRKIKTINLNMVNRENDLIDLLIMDRGWMWNLHFLNTPWGVECDHYYRLQTWIVLSNTMLKIRILNSKSIDNISKENRYYVLWYEKLNIPDLVTIYFLIMWRWPWMWWKAKKNNLTHTLRFSHRHGALVCSSIRYTNFQVPWRITSKHIYYSKNT